SAEGVNSFRLRHALLYVGRGEGGVGADGALVHQRAPLDDHGTAVDRNFRVLKAAVAALVPDTQLQDLAAAASDRVLVALAAGLRIEERTEAIRDGLEFLELRLVCLVRRIVCDAVTLVVEAGWRRRSRRWSGGWRARRTRGGNQAEAESSNPNQSVHGSLRGFLRIRESMPVTAVPSNPQERTCSSNRQDAVRHSLRRTHIARARRGCHCRDCRRSEEARLEVERRGGGLGRQPGRLPAHGRAQLASIQIAEHKARTAATFRREK